MSNYNGSDGNLHNKKISKQIKSRVHVHLSKIDLIRFNTKLSITEINNRRLKIRSQADSLAALINSSRKVSAGLRGKKEPYQ